MIENHVHYNLEKQTPEIQKLAADYRLLAPLFIGQGCTYSVGSDSYGKYLVDIKQIGKKTVYGLVNAKAVFGPEGWTAGTEYCSMPDDKTPTEWITQSGWWKNKRTGEKRPKYYFCDKNGKKFNGRKCTYDFNGCYSSKDPSF